MLFHENLKKMEEIQYILLKYIDDDTDNSYDFQKISENGETIISHDINYAFSEQIINL